MRYIIIGIIVLLIIGVLFLPIYVKSRSQKYKTMLDINKKYSKLRYSKYRHKIHDGYRFDTKPKFDNVNNRDKIFQEYLYTNRDVFLGIKENIDENIANNARYINELEDLDCEPDIPYWSFVENKILEKKIMTFNTDFILKYDMKYSSPQGRNSYISSDTFTINDVIGKLEQIENDHVEKTEYQIFSEAERAKVTAGVRYDILKRDNFTCRYCGASSKTHGVLLHVDHIKPIKKGGLSEESNLQTLCATCNLGKGTKD